jgi:chromosome partitioning protein
MNLALVNVKGGVGKTTAAVSLAAAFAGSGLRVLVVDLDPQGSASFSLGTRRAEADPSAAEVLRGKATASDALRSTEVPGVELIPGSLRLAEVELGLARKDDPEKRLKAALAPLRRRFDVVVMDCPPGMSLLTLNALTAAHAYIVPVVPNPLEHDALAAFFELLEQAKDRIGKMPELLGILLTKVDYRTRVTHEMVQAIRSEHGSKVFKTEIPVNVRLAEAPSEGATIFDFEESSTGAHAYSRLGGEVLRRARRNELL